VPSKKEAQLRNGPSPVGRTDQIEAKSIKKNSVHLEGGQHQKHYEKITEEEKISLALLVEDKRR